MLFHRSLTAALVLVVAQALLAQKTITNRDIWASPTFRTEQVGGLASMNDGQHYTSLEPDGEGTAINQYAYRTGKLVSNVVRSSLLVPAGSKEPLSMDGYSFSGDEKRMMIETGSEPLYRYSYFAHNYVFDRTTKQVVPLADPGKAKQRLATFSPDGARAAFVRDNNLFTVDLASMTETQVTFDGEWNKVIYGATDWVYEEEFTLVQGYAWSPQGTKILFLRSDESAVKEFTVPFYQGQLYPSEHRFKYPKAGEVNSVVSLFVYDVGSKTTKAIPLGATGDYYVPRLGWTASDDVLWFMRMDRLQNEKVILSVDLRERTAEPAAREVYKEYSTAYFEPDENMHFVGDGSGFILTSEKSGWNHIHFVPFTGTPRPITTGEWDVIEVKGIDEKGKRILFTASRGGPSVQEVMSIGLNGTNLRELSPKGGWNDAEFSKGFQWFINTRSTANSVPVVTLHDGQGKQVNVLKDNAALQRAVGEYGLVPREFFQFTTPQGVVLNGWMMKPPGVKEGTRSPVFMVQYSGPGSNEVVDRWDGRDHLWNSLLAHKGYIVACVDGRGTGRRGKDFRQVTYGRLGKFETEDQIAAAKWLGQQPGVDKDRIGIFGWSYGGYMSSLCITKGADVFKAAIAVAPVSNWRFYDTIYTERYMGLPEDNGDGYDTNSPINHVDKLKGNYLLVHGMADDNVHFQNAAEMINALVKANKPFEQFAYPDRNHGIYGGSTRLHLFEMMTAWLDRNL